MRKLTLLVGCALLLSPVLASSQSVLTRADAVRILLLNRTDNVPLFPNVNRFPDVPPGYPNERYLLAAERYGIISANPTTHLLRPDDPVNRATFLKMLTLTFGVSTDLPEDYNDVSDSDWFKSYAGLAYSYHLFPGDNTALHPTQPMTDDDAVAVIGNLEDVLQKSSEQQQVSKDQADHKLQLYVVISTKRLNTVFAGNEGKNAQPVLTTTDDAKLEDLRQQVLNLVNDQREKNGAQALKLNTLLDGSAQQYAQDMAQQGFFSHVSPTGQTLRDRIAASGYENRTFQKSCGCIPGYALAENLARGQRTPQEAVNAWMKSPEHREALLSTDYTDTGIGIEAGVWVQHFGGILEP